MRPWSGVCGSGSSVTVGDGGGVWLEGTVADVSASRVDVTITARSAADAPTARLVLVQALAKGDRDELAVQASCELGVDEIVPWQGISQRLPLGGRESCQGPGALGDDRPRGGEAGAPRGVPSVSEPVTSKQLLARAEGARMLVLDPTATARLSEVRVRDAGAEELLLIVGPEGGISPEEFERLRPRRCGSATPCCAHPRPAPPRSPCFRWHSGAGSPGRLRLPAVAHPVSSRWSLNAPRSSSPRCGALVGPEASMACGRSPRFVSLRSTNAPQSPSLRCGALSGGAERRRRNGLSERQRVEASPSPPRSPQPRTPHPRRGVPCSHGSRVYASLQRRHAVCRQHDQPRRTAGGAPSRYGGRIHEAPVARRTVLVRRVRPSLDDAFAWEKRLQGWSHAKRVAFAEGGLEAVVGWQSRQRKAKRGGGIPPR